MMSSDECSDFVQHELIALDIHATTETTDTITELGTEEEHIDEEITVEKKSDFISRNK
jgi:hypothetical protein